MSTQQLRKNLLPMLVRPCLETIREKKGQRQGLGTSFPPSRSFISTGADEEELNKLNLPNTANTVSVVNTATKNYPGMHPSFLVEHRVTTQGQLAQAPNPQGRGTSPRQERDSQHCVRTPHKRTFALEGCFTLGWRWRCVGFPPSPSSWVWLPVALVPTVDCTVACPTVQCHV